jgi:hypothetical protein
MNTLSIKLRYRPLRLGWCIASGDFEAFRRSLRLTFTMWGGRFNPIIPIDEPRIADALIKLFRVDALVPASGSDTTTELVGRYKYLPWPLLNDGLFGDGGPAERRASIADLLHPIAQLYEQSVKNNPSPTPIVEIHEWDAADPLADIFLATYGGLPSIEETGTDYAIHAGMQLGAVRNIIQPGGELPIVDPVRMSLSALHPSM